MTSTKTSKRLSSRCHVEKYSCKLEYKRFEVWANCKIHLGAIKSFSGKVYIQNSEVVAQTANYSLL
jgi:cytoplasmic iron level regulating protein YaaA (DUF328/UPF0246 family)